MEDKKQHFEINIKDSVAIGQSNGKKVKSNMINTVKRPSGVVEVYEINKELNTKQLIRKNNLVVYVGREWVAQRLFALNNPAIDPDVTGGYTEYIRWAGIGSQGCTIDDLNPDPPENDDITMRDEVPFSTADIGYCDHRVGENGLGYYKKPISSDDISFEPDEANKRYVDGSPVDSYLVVKIVFTIGEDDANGYNISEAGLYTSDGLDLENGPFHLFARVSFPTIAKTSGRDLLFVWYIYC